MNADFTWIIPTITFIVCLSVQWGVYQTRSRNHQHQINAIRSEMAEQAKDVRKILQSLARIEGYIERDKLG